MYPFSYISLKIVHDEKIQAALEHQRLYAGQERQGHALFQAFGKFLARFDKHPARRASVVSGSLRQAPCSEN
jgi:hypothetical protein